MAASVVVMAGDHVDHTRPLGRARPPFLAAQHEALGLPLRYGRDTGWGGAGAGLSDSEGAENSTAGERGQVALAHGRIAETQNWPHAEAIVEANESGQREVNGTELAQSPKVFLVVEAEQATLFSGYLHAKQAAVAEVERHGGRGGGVGGLSGGNGWGGGGSRPAIRPSLGCGQTEAQAQFEPVHATWAAPCCPAASQHQVSATADRSVCVAVKPSWRAALSVR